MISSFQVTRSVSRVSKLTGKPRFRSTISSQTATDEENYTKGFYPVYVHHVSKVALERLQKGHSSWISSKGLDSGLHINPNGTFTLSFPAREGFDSGRIWWVSQTSCGYRFLNDIRYGLTSHSSIIVCRTSYDSSKKQHWLSFTVC